MPRACPLESIQTAIAVDLTAVPDSDFEELRAATVTLRQKVEAEAQQRLLATLPRVEVHRGKYAGSKGRLSKRTASGGQIRLDSGVQRWIGDTCFSECCDSRLNVDLLVYIFSFLTQREVAGLRLVSRAWCEAAGMPNLWKDWEFVHVSSLGPWMQQIKFLSYGRWMKSRGASARSLRFLSKWPLGLLISPLESHPGASRNDAVEIDLTRGLHVEVNPCTIAEGARTVKGWLNWFFEGVDCSKLFTILLGHGVESFPLQTLSPLMRARALTKLSLISINSPRYLLDSTDVCFPQVASISLTFPVMWGQGPEKRIEWEIDAACAINRVLAACPVATDIDISMTIEGDPRSRKISYSYASTSVKTLTLLGKGGFRLLSGLKMPELEYLKLDCYDPFRGARCLHDICRTLPKLKEVKQGGRTDFMPISRDPRDSFNRFCHCNECE